MEHSLYHSLYRPMMISCITASSFMVGCQLSLSYVSAMALLNTPNISEEAALNQFSTIFWRGHHLCPTAAFFTGLTCYANAALSFYHYSGVGGRSTTLALRTGIVPRLLLTGTLVLAIVPYTLTWIVPVEDPLLHREKNIANIKRQARRDLKLRKDGDDERHIEAERTLKERDGRETEQTLEQVRLWSRLNYVRALFPAAGVISAWYLCW